MQWENVYVFISSTFNDMHAERDYLVKRVFPQLAEWCEERKLRLVDIDLRWGVSEADATKNKRVVQVCLDRIDACRPFFLCFLGQRRGWVPGEGDIGDETYESFPKLLEKHYLGSASVTEMEILHALVDPLHNGILRLSDGGTQPAEPVEHALFFLRDPAYLQTIAHPDTRRIYTNEAEADPAKADDELNRWRQAVIPGTGSPVFNYSATWEQSERTPEITLPLYVPTTAPRGSSTWKVAFLRWAKMWEDKGVKVDDNGEITDQAALSKAKEYNDNFTKGRLSCFTHEGTDLANIIIEQMKAAITERFGERAEQALAPLQHELDQQAQFLQVASEGFIEREGDFGALNAYLTGAQTKPFGLTAYAGMGKTSLLAHFVDTYQLKDAKETLHYRFIGVSDDSVSVERLIGSLLLELKERGKIQSEIPANTADMLNKLPEFLKEAGQNGKTILIIDALNQLESGMANLSWIPAVLPQNVKLVVSFKRGDKDTEAYYAQLAQNQTVILHEIKPFASMNDRKKLVTAYLGQFFKELDEPRIQALIGSEGAENPLFLKIALSELRVFGVHNDLSAMIKNSFGNTPVSAYHAVLSRMESDPAYTRLPPSLSLPHVFGWLSHSKYGLSVKELCDLLIREKLTDNPNEAQDAVYLILRQLRPYLAKRDGRVDFFYESFKIAASERYTKHHSYARTEEEWHKSLADYFEILPLENRHRLMEQAWQYAMAGMGEKLKMLLFSYPFLAAKLHEFDVGSLESDFDCVLLPGAALSLGDVKVCQLLRSSLSVSAHILTKRKDQLASQLWIRLICAQEAEIKDFLSGITRELRARGQAWLRPQRGFEKPGGALKRTFEIAGSVAEQVATSHQGKYLYSTDGLCNIKRWDASSGALLATYEGGFFAITPDGRYILTISDGFSLKLFDVITGDVVLGFKGNHKEKISKVVISREGKQAVSCSEDGTFKVWDISSGKCIVTTVAHDEAVCCVDISKDGRRILTGGMDGKMKLWSLGRGSAKLEFAFVTPSRMEFDSVYSVSFTHDGQKAVCTSFHEKAVYLVNLATQACEKAYEGQCFAVSPDNRHLLAATAGGTLKLWKIEDGQCLKAFRGHTGNCSCISFFSDGQHAVSASYDQTMKLWDTFADDESVGAEEHQYGVSYMALSPDDKLLLTGAKDEMVMFWDLESAKRLHIRKGHRGETTAVRFRSDGRYALTGGALDNCAALWDMERCERIKTYIGHDRWVNAVAFSPEGERVLTGSSDGTLKLWDLDTEECIRTYERHEGNFGNVVSAEFSAGGKMILSGAVDGSVKLWEASTGRCVGNYKPPSGRRSEKIRLCFSADGKRILSNIGDAWDIHTGQYSRISKPECLKEMNPNKRYLSQEGSGGEVELYDLYTGNTIASFVMEGDCTCSACTGDGAIVVAGNSGGRVYFLALENVPRSDVALVQKAIIPPEMPAAPKASADGGAKTSRAVESDYMAKAYANMAKAALAQESKGKPKGLLGKIFGKK